MVLPSATLIPWPKPKSTARLLQSLSFRPVGDKVRLATSDTVFTITKVHGDNQVELNLDGTNIYRYRVPAQDLIYVEHTPRPVVPPKPRINVEEVRERLATAQHASMDQLSGDIAVLKKYLKSKNVSADVAQELDRLCKDTEDSWRAAVAKITELL